MINRSNYISFFVGVIVFPRRITYMSNKIVAERETWKFWVLAYFYYKTIGLLPWQLQMHIFFVTGISIS